MASIRTSLFYLLIISVAFLFGGCGLYSFQGGKLSPGLETVSIERFENNASLVVPTLAVDLTEALKDKFQSQSNLKLRDYDGDLQFSGSISGYSVSPVAIQGDETAAQNRLSVSVRVVYDNSQYPEQSWQNTFTQFQDFDSNLNLSDVEAELLLTIIDQLTTDIFNKVLSNW